MTAVMISGSIPTPVATEPMIGKKAAAVAVLLVSSVRPSPTTAATISTTSGGMSPKAATWLPTQTDRPVAVKAAERLSPPPKSSSSPQGMSREASQVSSATGRPEASRSPEETRKQASAAAIATWLEEIPDRKGSAAPTAAILVSSGTATQKKMAPRKISATRDSALLIGPSASTSLRISAAPPGSSRSSER